MSTTARRCSAFAEVLAARHCLLQYHKASATVVRFSPRSMFLASGSRDGTIALWDIYQPSALGSPQLELGQAEQGDDAAG